MLKHNCKIFTVNKLHICKGDSKMYQDIRDAMMTDHQYDSIMGMAYEIVSKCKTIEEAKDALRKFTKIVESKNSDDETNSKN